MTDQTSDPFERAAQREERMRQWGQHWQVTTLVIVQIGLITFTAILAAWAWIDNRTGAADLHDND